MILSQIRDYLRQRQRVALRDLCNHFQTDTDALRAMLAVWINKGKVRKMPVSKNCGSSCCKCDAALTEFYEWVD